MTFVQVITGGAPIDQDVIDAAGCTRLFSDEVEGWNPGPELPENPDRGPGFQGLPVTVREALAQAMAKSLEKVTGFRIKVYTR